MISLTEVGIVLVIVRVIIEVVTQDVYEWIKSEFIEDEPRGGMVVVEW